MRATSLSASRRVQSHHHARNGRAAGTDGDEPEVVDARRQDESGVDVAVVPGERRRRVRRQHDAVPLDQRCQIVERVVDADVGIEIHRLAGASSSRHRSSSGLTAVASSVTS